MQHLFSPVRILELLFLKIPRQAWSIPTHYLWVQFHFYRASAV